MGGSALLGGRGLREPGRASACREEAAGPITGLVAASSSGRAGVALEFADYPDDVHL